MKLTTFLFVLVFNNLFAITTNETQIINNHLSSNKLEEALKLTKNGLKNNIRDKLLLDYYIKILYLKNDTDEIYRIISFLEKDNLIPLISDESLYHLAFASLKSKDFDSARKYSRLIDDSKILKEMKFFLNENFSSQQAFFISQYTNKSIISLKNDYRFKTYIKDSLGSSTNSVSEIETNIIDSFYDFSSMPLNDGTVIDQLFQISGSKSKSALEDVILLYDFKTTETVILFEHFYYNGKYSEEKSLLIVSLSNKNFDELPSNVKKYIYGLIQKNCYKICRFNYKFI